MNTRTVMSYLEATRTLEALGYTLHTREDRPWREDWEHSGHTMHLPKGKDVPVVLVMRARCHALRASIADIKVLDHEPEAKP